MRSLYSFFYVAGLLALLSGCNQINRYPEHIELIAAKFDIYQQLELNKRSSANRCQINFQATAENIQIPDAQLGLQGGQANRQQDSRAWMDALRQAEGAGDAGTATPQGSNATSPSPSSSLFGSDAPTASPSGSISTPSTSAGAFGETGTLADIEDNEYYSLTILSQELPYYTQINLPTPSSSAATLVVPAKAKLNMKQTSTNRSSFSYDSVDVEITYFLSRVNNGTWVCMDRDVAVVRRLSSFREEQGGGVTPRRIPRW